MDGHGDRQQRNAKQRVAPKKTRLTIMSAN